MDTLTNGLSQEDFTLLNVLHNGSMQNIISLIGSLGGGSVDSASTPLSISGGVLSIDLSSYTNTAGLTTLLASKLDTSHEAGKIGNANVAHGAFDINTRTLTLQNNSGVTAVLSVDNRRNLNKGVERVVTTPILNAPSPTNLTRIDNEGAVRSLAASLTAAPRHKQV